MSFSARLIHSLTHVRIPYDEGTLDDRGQPTPGSPVETAVRGLVQPRTVSELADFRDAGSEVAQYVIFLEPMDLDPSDSFTYSGATYQIQGIRRFEFGRTPHLEVDCRRVEAPAVVSVGS